MEQLALIVLGLLGAVTIIIGVVAVTFLMARRSIKDAEALMTTYFGAVKNSEFELSAAFCAEELQSGNSPSDIVSLLHKLSQRLGEMQHWERGPWHVTKSTKGTFYVIEYTTTYSRTMAVETFVLSRDSDGNLPIGTKRPIARS